MRNSLHLPFYLLLCISTCAVAQTLRQPLQANYTAMGAYSVQHADLFSSTINPASLARVKKISVGAFTEKRFMLEAFTHSTMTFALPAASGSFALQGDYFGYRNYNETQLGFAYGRSLGSKVDIGVRFNYYQLRIPAYTRSSTFHFEAGLLMHFTEKLHGGFSIFNPAGGMLNKETNEKIASVYRGGLGYETSEHFFITAEVVKEENKPVGVYAGFQYKPVTALQFRAGVNTVSSQPFFGAGLIFRQLRIDLTVTHHPQLGISPGLLLLYHFQKSVE